MPALPAWPSASAGTSVGPGGLEQFGQFAHDEFIPRQLEFDLRDG